MDEPDAGPTALVLSVPTDGAKPVKDALKKAGWLHATLKPLVRPTSIAFPLADGAEPAVRAALGGDGVLASAAAAAESLAVSEFAAKKKPPQQGRHASSVVKKGASIAPPPRRAAPPQERSFGSGAGGRVSASVLPPAAPVRRVACPPDVTHAWLQQHVRHPTNP